MSKILIVEDEESIAELEKDIWNCQDLRLRSKITAQMVWIVP